jgi:glucokinase
MVMIILGIDIGATNVKGVVLSDNKTIYKTQSPVKTTNPRAFKKSIYDFIDDILLQNDISAKKLIGIGVGTPGPIDLQKGLILTPVNMKYIGDFPLVQTLEERYNTIIIHDNDANMAIWGELTTGAGVECEHLIMLTLGTGIGGGIIIESELVHGASGNAGELGHTVVNDGGRECSCGRKGCLEAYASGTGIVSGFKERLNDRNTIIDYYGIPIEDITADILHTFATENNDGLSKETYREMGYYLGVGVSNFINIFSPQKVIIAGGVMGAKDLFWDTMMGVIEVEPFSINVSSVEIVGSKLGFWSGAIGAGLRVREFID